MSEPEVSRGPEPEAIQVAPSVETPSTISCGLNDTSSVWEIFDEVSRLLELGSHPNDGWYIRVPFIQNKPSDEETEEEICL